MSLLGVRGKYLEVRKSKDLVTFNAYLFLQCCQLTQSPEIESQKHSQLNMEKENVIDITYFYTSVYNCKYNVHLPLF